jgi:hypothetical protein
LIMQQPSFAIHDQIAALAQHAGFSKAGIAPIPPPGEEAPELNHFEPWIERGYAGEMEYLKRRDEANRLLRSSLRIAVPWARSVIVCAANYNADAPKSIDPASEESGWIARYAWTGYAGQPSDYHDVLLHRLQKLEQNLQAAVGPFQSRCYVDREEHLHSRPGTWIMAFSGRDSDWAGAAVRRASPVGGRPLRQLHAMPRCLSHRRPDRALPDGCEPMYLLPYD